MNTRPVVFIDPEGNLYRFYSIREGCDEFGLSYHVMRNMVRGLRVQGNQGWRCYDALPSGRYRVRIYDPETESDEHQTAKYRHCLMCGERFFSRHIGNRVCEHCRDGEIWRSGEAIPV